MFKSKILWLFIATNTTPLFAQKVVYYGHEPKFVEVNSREQTMLSFPSPAYAYSCNPSGSIELQRVESLTDYDQMTLKLMQHDKKEAERIRANEASSTARLMRLIPLKIGRAHV